MHISLWGTYSTEGAEVFILTDAAGNKVHRTAEIGDHVKIHFTWSALLKADGADWVRVESINEEKNKRLDEILIAVTLRQCSNACLKDNDIAHFYDDKSTNTIIVCRHKTEVSSSIHGRNELMNTDTDWLDCLRNIL